MLSIGVLTFHRTVNYGGVLQAYALQTVLKSMGYNAEIIDYFDYSRDLASLSLFHRAKHIVWHEIVKKMIAGSVRENRTEQFRCDNLRFSKHKYTNAKALHANPPLYDAYITGSDQVWNPRNNCNDSSYFLTFAPGGKRRIAYAASFGVSQLQDRNVKDYAAWLKHIDFISTREIEGKQIVGQLNGRDAQVTLDPTLLLGKEQWSKVAVPYRTQKPYVLCYYMPGDKKVNDNINRLASFVSQLTGWDIVGIGQKEYMRFHPFRRNLVMSGPAEFLGLFQNASFVVTNSFHGTAFAVNFRIPFLVPINRALSPDKALSSRITTLVKVLGLEDRLVDIGSGLPGNKCLELNFKTAEKLLFQETQRSLSFLQKALDVS